MNRLFVAVALGCTCVFWLEATVARADIISVANPSFESPVVSGNSAEVLATGWHSTDTTAEIDCGTYAATYYGVVPDGNQVQTTQVPNMWQNLGVALVPGTTYTLTFEEAHFNMGNSQPGLAKLLAASDTTSMGTAFASVETVRPNDTHFYTETLTATYTGAEGYYLSISMGPKISGWLAYDAVSVTSQSVPEPSVVALLTTALIGLLCYAWRKRK
jgi:hypothetical protein